MKIKLLQIIHLADGSQIAKGTVFPAAQERGQYAIEYHGQTVDLSPEEVELLSLEEVDWEITKRALLQSLIDLRDLARTGLPVGGMTETQWAKHRLNIIAGKLTRLIVQFENGER